MGTMIATDTFTLDQRAAGLTREEEIKLVSIVIDSSLYLEMSLADRKRLIRYLLTMYY